MSTKIRFLISLVGVAILFLATRNSFTKADLNSTTTLNPTTITIMSMASTPLSNGEVSGINPQMVQVQVQDLGGGNARGIIIFIDSPLNYSTSSVPVYQVNHVNYLDQNHTQFVINDSSTPNQVCDFYQDRRNFSCQIDNTVHSVALSPNSVVTIPAVATPFPLNPNSTSFNQSFYSPEWNQITQDMECRNLFNRACHDNAYPTVQEWSAFIQHFNQLITTTNQMNNPQLSGDMQRAANQVAAIGVDPRNPNQVKISRDQYIALKSDLLAIQNNFNRLPVY